MYTSISHLKDHLSEILKIVQQGQEVSVTSHHQLIAKIVPTEPQKIHGKNDQKSFINELKVLHVKLKHHKFPSLKKAIIDARRKEQY